MSRRRTGPPTGALVALALLLMLIQGFGAVMGVLSFMGSRPSRAAYNEAAMACLTTLPAFGVLVWWGWLGGSRVGIWLIGGPATVMVLAGLNLLATTGNSYGTLPTGSPGLDDLSRGGSLLNWGAVAVFGLCAVATYQQRRRARHTENASAA